MVKKSDFLKEHPQQYHLSHSISLALADKIWVSENEVPLSKIVQRVIKAIKEGKMLAPLDTVTGIPPKYK